MSQIIEQRIATLLGNFGLIPFFALAAASWVPFGAPYENFVEQALVGYAAVILSFLGAVHWGLALATPALDKAQAWNAFGWGIAPSALAWLALLLAIAGVHAGLVYAFLIGDIAICRLMDAALLRVYGSVPAWYPALRTRLTIGATIALAVALASTL
jgi:succinate dehydrogenase hydrophobic anchor subunit